MEALSDAPQALINALARLERMGMHINSRSYIHPEDKPSNSFVGKSFRDGTLHYGEYGLELDTDFAQELDPSLDYS